MIYIMVAIGAALIMVLTAPFFIGPGGVLQASSSINSAARLTSLREAVLSRYIADEAAFQSGTLSRLTWEKRRQFLTNRYVDIVRRLDYVNSLEQEAAIAAKAGATAAPQRRGGEA